MKKRLFALTLCAAMLLALGTQAGAAAKSLDKYLKDTVSKTKLTRYITNAEDEDARMQNVKYNYALRWDNTLGITPQKVTTSIFGSNVIEMPVKLMQELLSYGITLTAYDTGDLTVYLPNELENTWVGRNGSITTSVYKCDTKPKGTIGSAWYVNNDDSEDGFMLEFKVDKLYAEGQLALGYMLPHETKWRLATDAEFMGMTYENNDDLYVMCTNYNGLPSGAYALVRR